MKLLIQGAEVISKSTLRNEYIGFLEQHSWDVAITLTHPNSHNVSEEQSRKTIRRFLNGLDRKLLKWRNQKNDRRLKRFMIMEKGYSGSNIHWHGAFQIVQHQFEYDDFCKEIGNIWHSLQYAGAMTTKQIDDLSGWIRYSTKHLDCSGNAAEIPVFHFE